MPRGFGFFLPKELSKKTFRFLMIPESFDTAVFASVTRTSFPKSQRSQHHRSQEEGWGFPYVFAKGTKHRPRLACWEQMHLPLHHSGIHKCVFILLQTILHSKVRKGFCGIFVAIFFQCLQNAPIFFPICVSYTQLCLQNQFQLDFLFLYFSFLMGIS